MSILICQLRNLQKFLKHGSKWQKALKASKPDFKNQWGYSTGGTAVVGGVWITPYQSVMIHNFSQ